MKVKIGIAIAMIVLTVLTSCRTNGYGCHGTGREITGTSGKWKQR